MIQRENFMQKTLEIFNQSKFQRQKSTRRDFHAKVSALLETEEVSKTHEALYSLKSHAWLKKDSLNIFSSKMSKDCSITMEDKPSQQSSTHWKNWGIGGNIRCLTANISESPKTEKECSLSD